MHFLYPNFLWALGALAIPIIIHLFYFRRFKTVYFTNVKYLQEVKEETSSRSRLRNLLILITRLLALASIIFAFAQPFIPTGENVKTGNNAVSVYVDNSFSMNAEKDEIPLIDIAKEKARQIINAYSETDEFQIITNDFKARQQRLISKEDALTAIDEIEVSPEVQTITKVINRQSQVFDTRDENKIAYLISDVQSSIFDLSSSIDSTIEVNILPLQSVQEKNVSIDSAWLESPAPLINQNNRILVKISNHSNDEAEGIRLSMQIDGQERPEGLFTIPANTSITDTINFTPLKPGFHRAQLKIADYPIQFDDSYFITINVPSEINALAINGNQPNKYLNALFAGLNLYKITNVNQNGVDYSKLKEYDVIILNDLDNISSGLASELDQYVVNGGNALVFPSANANITSYNQFLNNMSANTLDQAFEEEKVVSFLNKEEFIFKDVFEYINNNVTLPKTNRGFTLTNYQSRAEETILGYRDGNKYLTKYKRGEGHLYLFTSPLNDQYNDLVLNAEIFVPMLYKMAISSSKRQKISYTIGKDNIVETDNASFDGELVYQIKGQSEFIPGITNLGNKVLLDVNDQIQQEGFYTLELQDNTIADLAFNYDRLESDLSVLKTSELENQSQNWNFNILDSSLTSDFSTYINEKDKGVVLWKWFLFASLLFLILETILLRFLRE